MQSSLPDTFIHSSAFTDEGCRIGTGTRIWHFCHIMASAQIGCRCILGQNVFVGGGVSIGDGVKIQNNVSVYTGVKIEDDVFIGPSVVFTNVLTPRAFIERKEEFLPTLIKKGASLGANATIVCGVTVGSYALVGAGTVVITSVPDFALMVGNPGRQIGWVSRAGRRLNFSDDGTAKCPETGEKYRLMNNEVLFLAD